MKYTKEEFKRLWESDNNGGGLTFDDVADCAKDWGISQNPRIRPMLVVRYQVLKAADVVDAENYFPNEDDY